MRGVLFYIVYKHLEVHISMYRLDPDPEFIKLFNGKFGVGSIPMNIKMLRQDEIIHTNKSRAKMTQFSLSKNEVMNAINVGEKVQQNDTILCNGPVNVRMVKKDDKYIIIDLYKK